MSTTEEISHPVKQRKGKSVNIYIQPESDQQKSKDRDTIQNICIIADGNNRALGLNAGYKDAGKNVIKLARYLQKKQQKAIEAGEQQPIDTATFCIVSPDNIENRGKPFFWKMYQAFLGLGISMETEGVLDDIIVDVAGDLKILSEMGEPYSLFRSAVDVVCKRSKERFEAKKAKIRATEGDAKANSLKPFTLKLGVNYLDKDIEDAQAILRTGMKSEKAARLSGSQPKEGAKLIGRTVLFPQLTEEMLEDEIQKAEETTVNQTSIGHSLDTIVQLATTDFITQEHDGIIKDVNITVPFLGSTEELEAALAAQESSIKANITLINEEGIKKTTPLPNGSPITLTIIPANGKSVKEHTDGKKYTHFVMAGQPDSPFVLLNDQPELNKATLIGSEKGVDGVIAGVRDSVQNAIDEEILDGGERHSTQKIRLDAFHSELDELTQIAQQENYEECTMEELGKSIFPLLENDNVGTYENFLEVEKRFMAFALKWFQKKGFIGEYNELFEPKFRGFRGYARTALFMVYGMQYKSKQNSKGDHKAWIQTAFGQIAYMLGVFGADEYVNDFKIGDPEKDDEATAALAKEKKQRLDKASNQIFCNAVEGVAPTEEDFPEDLPNKKEVFGVASVFVELSQNFSKNHNAYFVKQWKSRMKNLFNSFDRESTFSPINLSPLITEGIDETPSAPGRLQIDINRLLGRVHPYLRNKLAAGLDKMRQGDMVIKLRGEAEFNLYQWLDAIEDSIGAGNTFRTLACCEDRDLQEIDEETIEVFEELCLLMNLYYRIANDISGTVSRNYADREEKTDCCTFMAAQYTKKIAIDNKSITNEAKTEALIKGMVDLKKIMDEIGPLIDEKQKILMEKWPTMGIAVAHTDFAKMIYQVAHYRTITLAQMNEWLSNKENFNCAVKSPSNDTT